MNYIKEFQNQLLNWYKEKARELPWRSDPNPYKVWVSEAMLQQTRVDTVIPYFNRFVEEIPTVESLAKVEDEKLFKLWQGLGYYRRATFLKKSAQIIVKQYNGELPSKVDELLSLPGIGAYTAGAIASIAFNISVPAIDGNVLRVMARINAEQGDIKNPQVKKQIEEFVKILIPDNHAGDFNQAIMDLGAGVCLPNGIPKCSECPVKEFCRAYAKGLVSQIPLKIEKKARKRQEKTILTVQWNGRIAIRKRKNNGLLANLWELPNFDGFLPIEQCIMLLEESGLRVTGCITMKKAKHIFTHIEWNMQGYSISVEGQASLFDWTWATAEEIHSTYSIPTTFQAFLSEFMNQVTI